MSVVKGGYLEFRLWLIWSSMFVRARAKPKPPPYIGPFLVRVCLLEDPGF